MLKSKFFDISDDLVIDSKDLFCHDHNMSKKYYAMNQKRFYCEHDYIDDPQTVHFRSILDKYIEDIKILKNLSINDTENTILKELYDQSNNRFEKVLNLNNDLNDFILKFGKDFLSKFYKNIMQDQEIFNLKELIGNIKYSKDGRADYVGIGNDPEREKKYLMLARVLISRNLNLTDKKENNNLAFNLFNFMEGLQKYLINFIDESYSCIKYIFDTLLREVAKLEGDLIDYELNKHFIFTYIHRNEFDELSEKYKNQNKEINNLKNEYIKLEKEYSNLNKHQNLIISERDLMINKSQDDKYLIDKLNLKNEELIEDLNIVKNNFSFQTKELENEKNINKENNFQLNNLKIYLESLQLNIKEMQEKNDNFVGELKFEKNKFENSENQNKQNISIIINLENKLDQLQKSLLIKEVELNELRDNHDNHITMASGQVNDFQKLKNSYEKALELMEKDLLNEKKKSNETKTVLESNVNKEKLFFSELELKFKNYTIDSTNKINNLENIIAELNIKLSEIIKIKEKTSSELIELNKSFNFQTQEYNAKIIEINQTNISLEKKIKRLEEENLDIEKNYINNFSKHEENNKELNSTIFDLKCLNNALNKKIDEIELKLKENGLVVKKALADSSIHEKQYKDLLNLYNSSNNDLTKKKVDEEKRVIEMSIKLSDMIRLSEIEQKKIKELENIIRSEREKNQQNAFILEKNLKDKNVLLEEYSKTKDFLESELNEEKKKNNNIIQENKKLTEKNNKLLIINEKFQVNDGEVEELKNKNDELIIQFEAQVNQNELLTMHLEELEKEIQFERNKANTNNLNSKNSDIKNQYEAIFIHKEKLEKELIEKRTIISQLQILNNSINSKYEVILTELNSFKEQNKTITNLQKQSKTYMFQIDEINKIKSQLEIENNNLNNKINKISSELEQLKITNGQNDYLINKLREEINESKKFEKKFEILNNSKIEIEKLKNKFEINENDKIINMKIGNLIDHSLTKSIYDSKDYLTLDEKNSKLNEKINYKNEYKKDILSKPPRDTNFYNNIDFNKNNPQNLLIKNNHWILFKEWFSSLKIGGSTPITLNLLMKASRDGFGWKIFKDRCHGKSPTLTIVLTSFDKLIGGFTPLPWSSSEDDYEYLKDDSKKSFLFSLTNGKKYTLKNNQYAICNGNRIGPIFGGGSDLEIVDECNVNLNNFSAIGHTYECNESPDSFYGGKSFTIKDYEVYEVKY